MQSSVLQQCSLEMEVQKCTTIQKCTTKHTGIQKVMNLLHDITLFVSLAVPYVIGRNVCVRAWDVCVCVCVCQKKTRQMHIVTINITLLALCHADMFQPTDSHLRGLRELHFNSKINEISYLPDVQFSL